MTSLKYRLHEIDQVFAGPIFSNLEDADSLLRMFDDRLVQVKRAYDPYNLFHMNQNITP